jgi:hypothetical protein
VLVCGDEKDEYRDSTIDPEAEQIVETFCRVPFKFEGWRRFLTRVDSRITLPTWNKTPDRYSPWRKAVLRLIPGLIEKEQPALLVSFGHPMSDHLVGLEIRKRYRLPWIAHFSDPWTDNPFNKYGVLSKSLNLSLERKVIEAASIVIFTSDETRDLVMRKYPKSCEDKARVLPHAFDPTRYLQSAGCTDKLVIRHLGVFYGPRTPKPLFQALQLILESNPSEFEDVVFELVGWVDESVLESTSLDQLPSGLVVLTKPVNYQESLSLMSTADGLLVIDAPTSEGIFLPSKLIDYVGSGRPIMGFTPRGAASKVIQDLGGWVASSTDAKETVGVLRTFISCVRKLRQGGNSTWGNPAVRERYQVSNVARDFESLLSEAYKNERRELP